MKMLSNLKFEANEVLHRSELKLILGGNPACANDGDTVPISFNCGGGLEDTYNVCPEHVGATLDFIFSFC